jgi:hypothetical protein
MNWSIAHTFRTKNVEKAVSSVHLQTSQSGPALTLLEKGTELARAMAA